VSIGAPARIAMVAGEASGDALGAHLIEALSTALPGARFAGIGGPKMQAAGFDAWYPAETLAVGGYVEVLRHLPEILRVRRELLSRLLADPPDLFIGVDAPDFNLGLEEKLHARGIRTVQYVAPQVWAWRSHRVHQLRRGVDRVLALFPFEATLLEQADVPVSFVGHPLADQVPEVPDRQGAREQFRLSSAHTVVALLPGSRVREVESMGELFIRSAQLIHRQVRGVHFLVPLLSRATRSSFEQTLYRLEAQDLPLTILFGHAHMAMTAADSVLLASGTASLEAALLKRPMVVTYRLSPLTYALIKRRGYRLPYVALPNILAGRFIVPEILQDEATPENLAQAVINQLGDKVVRQRQEQAFLELHRALRQNTSERLVEAIVPLLSRPHPAGVPQASAPAGA
jgi:lipid-A-disaccharide synthase